MFLKSYKTFMHYLSVQVSENDTIGTAVQHSGYNDHFLLYSHTATIKLHWVCSWITWPGNVQQFYIPNSQILSCIP